MSKIVVNGRFLTRPVTGVDRFAREILMSAESECGFAAKLVVPSDAELYSPPSFTLSKTERFGRFRGHAWEQFDLPRFCHPEELLVSLCNTAPILFRRNSLVVIHDVATLAYPENFSFRFRAWYRLMISALVRNGAKIATVSKFSAEELSRFFDLPSTYFEVIYESGEHINRVCADSSIVQRLGVSNRRFVLAVGSRSPNKNFKGVVAAMAELSDPDIVLVAVGGTNARVFADAGLQGDRVIEAGYVSDEELKALYQAAQCFVFPSYYEGFGIPPLEAMHCGCPVVTSVRASLPEVCGNAAVYCEPDDYGSIARAIDSLISSPAYRCEVSERGLQHVKSFTWGNAARRFVSLVDSLN